MQTVGLWACALLAIGDGPRPADVIELVDGKTIEGYVVLEKADQVVVLVESREREVPVDKIAGIRSASRTLREVLDRHDSMPTGDAAPLVDLARYCKSRALPGESEVFALAALCEDLANQEAHLLLGHSQRKSGWNVKRGSRSVPFDELVPVRSDFKDPWKLQTSHYSLMTNLALEDAVGMALDLERFYRAFFQLLASEVEFYEVIAPLGVGVYADSRSFPEGVTLAPAYFDPTLEQVVVNAEATDYRTALAHEATHQVLHATAENTRSGRGEIPGWVNEGLAEYMACSLVGDPGRAKFDLGAIAEYHFATHRMAKKPYELSRVLNFATGDFHASSKVDLKYAQAYTLVHFFLHGEQGRYRDGFFAFLRSAYLGGSSTTDFKSVFDMREKDLEKAWMAHVQKPVR